ncbi:hypothetical protein [Erythrobacter litoralis]|uniref:Glycosyltransferase RgtA/B/C/D-like domain-containing protein n=1 Tax=Erythrobacter litoralis (strain HTCC2594) TaxID=314225 RepID=Q2N6V8_ERYLH|nr:hypothetical protein [Erythrobacter litoralis]ABC64583.1 hypothetical protein ELI_12455 [Erythrobacter litoralis HTCC2594]
MEDRRLRAGEHPLRRILAAWLLVCVLLVAVSMQNILLGRFPDPDDVLRLVQVRDLLAGQSWFDLKQHRIDPTGTVPMHWSRLVDIPLLVVIGGLTPLLGQPLAELVGVVLVPLLALLVSMLFVGRMAWRLFDVETAGLACLAMGFLALLVFQFQPLRIDHHGWQICAVIGAMWAINGRTGWKGGALAGLAVALGIAISLELLPIAALFGAVLALRWLRDAKQRFWLVGYLQSLAISLAVIFAATRGFADLALYCDALTLPHIGFFAIAAGGVTALSLLPRLPWPIVVVGLGMAGLAGIAAFGLASPQCLRTPFGALDPLLRDYWYANVLEGRPIWDQPALVYPQLLQIVGGFAIAIHLWRKAEGWKRGWWSDYVLVFAGTLLLGLFVWRSMAFASVMAALPLGYLLKRGLEAFRRMERPLQRIGVILGMALVLIPSAPYLAAQRLLASTGGSDVGGIGMSSCDLFDSADALGRLDTATIFAPLDIGPAILQRSPHAVVATGHHRAELAMKDVITAFTGTPEDARPIIERHGARYLVMCTDLVEPDIYVKRGGDGSLASALRDGTPPDWLEPVDLDTPETFRIWRVRPE